MNCSERLNTQAWLDSELDEHDRRAAKAHIESCAECRAFAAEAMALGDRLRRDGARYRAPEALAARIGERLDHDEETTRQKSGTRRGFWFGASSGVGLSAIAAGVAFLLLLPPSGATLLQSVTDTHVRALAGGQTVAVASSNHHTVKPWFAGRVPVSPPVADFGTQGFPLVGGRTASVAGQAAAVLAYRHGKHEIDLFVWADRGARLPASGVRHGYHVQVWKKGDLDFAAVSDTEASELAKFVRLVKSEPE